MKFFCKEEYYDLPEHKIHWALIDYRGHLFEPNKYKLEIENYYMELISNCV